MVRCATLSVPVIANPPVGFIVGVKVLAIPLHLPKKPVKFVSCQFGAKSVIQPVLCVIAEIEYTTVSSSSSVLTIQPKSKAMLLISSTVVIVLFFIFPLFRAFRPAAGIVFMCGFHGEGKDGRQGICGEIL